MQPIIAELREELFVSLLPPEPAGAEHSSPVNREQCANAVELRREDPQYDQSK